MRKLSVSITGAVMAGLGVQELVELDTVAPDEIVRALAGNPKLLLLDEPAAGMNHAETEELMSLIAKIRRDFKLAILLIEHDMKLVMGICERIVVLDHGEVIAAGAPADIARDPAVARSVSCSNAASQIIGRVAIPSIGRSQ